MKNSKPITLGLIIAALVTLISLSGTSFADKKPNCKVCGYSFGSTNGGRHLDCEKIIDAYPEWFQRIKTETPPKLRRLIKKQRSIMEELLMEGKYDLPSDAPEEVDLGGGKPVSTIAAGETIPNRSNSTIASLKETKNRTPSIRLGTTTFENVLRHELRQTPPVNRPNPKNRGVPRLNGPTRSDSPVTQPYRFGNSSGKITPYQKYPGPNVDPNLPPKPGPHIFYPYPSKP